jgi:cell division protein FtsB
MRDLSQMRFPFFLLVFCVFLSGSIFAETQNDSTLTRFKLEAAAKLTQAFMVDYQSTKEEKKEKLDEKEADGLEMFTSLLVNKSLDTLTGDDVLAFLKNELNGWSSDGPGVFNSYGNDLKDLNYAIEDLSKVITYNPKGNDGRPPEFFDQKRESVMKELTSDWLVDYQTVSEKEIETEKVSNETKPSTSGQKPKSSSQGYMGQTQEIVLVGLLFFLLIYSIYATTKWRGRKEKLSKVERSLSLRIENLERQLGQKQNENFELQQKVNGLNKKIESSKINVSELNDSAEAGSSKNESKRVVDQEWDREEVQPKFPQVERKQETVKVSSVFFISAPESDCKFLTTEIQLEEKSEPYYRFEGKEEGEFQINTSGNIDYEVLFNSPDLYLRNAAEYENNLKSEHVSIQNVSKGKFKVSGDSIVVIQKAKIRFV